MNTLKWLLVTLLLLQGCSDNEPEEEWESGYYTRGFKHTKNSIIRFDVKGYGGRVPPYGESGMAMGGGSFPKVWRPDYSVDVNWTVDPNSDAYISWDDPEYDEKMALHRSLYQKHSATVVLEPYDDKVCGYNVHFLACNQVRIHVGCYGPKHPDNPIKEPRKMEEPEVCP